MKIFGIIKTRIRYKLVIAFAFISLFTGIAGYFGLSTIRDIESGYGLIATKSLPLIQHLEDMKFNCVRLISSATEYAYIRSESKNAPQRSSLEQENKLIQQSCNSCHKAFHQTEAMVKKSFPEVVDQIKEIREGGKALQAAVNEFMEIKKRGISGAEALEKKEKMEVGEMNFLKAVNNAINHMNENLDEEKSQLGSTITSSFRNILVFSLLTFFISVFIGILMARSISKPIIKLTQLADAFKEGNLNAVTVIRSADEVGVLGRSFNEMAEKIKLLISQLEDEIKLTKQAEELIKKSNQQIKLILEVAGEGIIGLDLSGNHTFVNPMVSTMLGYKVEELLGKQSHRLFHHSYPDGTLYPDEKCPVYETLKDGKIHNGEEYFWKKDGTGFPVVFSSFPIIENEIITGAVVTFRDITERKRTEVEIAKRNEELKKIVAEKDKLFSIIAHDLRSPFSSFLGLTKIMAEELPSLTRVEIQKIVVSLRNSAANLYTLLENLLQWARSQRGLIPFNPQVVQLFGIVDNSIVMMLEHAKSKEIEISYDIPYDLKVLADSNMLQTIIRNLVSNAVKFTPKGGKIIISATVTGDNSVEISIKDSGIGMNREMLDNLFQLDVQINREGTKGEPSAGLGLLLCKEFVEKLGGRIWVESESENLFAGKAGGSTFAFSLPMEGQPADHRVKSK